MVRNKDLFARIEKLSEQVQELANTCIRIEGTLHFLQKVVLSSEANHTRMADRLIQMAMVQRGDTHSALGLRTQERIENEPLEPEPEEEPWPGEGRLMMELN